MPAIYRHFDCGNPSIGVVSADAGQFFGGHAMRREYLRDTAASMSLLWDGGHIDRHRVSSASRTYFGRRVSVHFMLQPIIANDVLSDRDLIDQGLLARMLVAWPTSRVGDRQILDERAYDRDCAKADTKLETFHSCIRQLLERPLPVRADDPLELVPRQLKLADTAKSALIDFYNRTEAGQKPDGPFAHIQGFASKIAEQACRIAGVLTIFEDPDANEVSIDCMQNAIEVAEWFLMELCRLKDCGYVSPDLRDAEVLREWLLHKRAGRAVNIRDLIRSGPRPAHNSQRARSLIGILQEHGWVKRLPEYAIVNGTKSKLAWLVVA